MTETGPDKEGEKPDLFERKEEKRDKFTPTGEIAGGYDLGMARAYALEHAMKTIGESVGKGRDSRPLIWEVDKAGWDEDAECWEVVLTAQPARAQVQQKGTWLYHVRPMGGLLPGTPLLRQEMVYTLPRARRGGRLLLALGIIAALGLVGGAGAVFLLGRGAPAPPPTPTPLPVIVPQVPPTPIPPPVPTPTPTTAQQGPQIDTAQVKELEVAVRTDPKNEAALQKLGDIYLTAEKWEDAAKWYGKLLEVNPRHVNATIDLGTAQFYLNRPDMAKMLWVRAIELDPKNAEAHFNLGIFYSVVEPRDPEAAQREWQKVVEIDPNSRLAEIVRQRQQPPTPSAPESTPATEPTQAPPK